MAQKLSYGGNATGENASGVALPIATPMLEAWWDEIHPRNTFNDWSGWNFEQPTFITDSLPTPAIPQPPYRKPGVLYWPSGASRPAWFHTVVNKDKLEEIKDFIGTPMTPQPLTFFDSRSGKTISPLMYMLPPRPLNQLGHTSSDGWFLTFTDQRFFWHWRRGTVTTTTSWEDLIQAVAGVLGITIAVDTVNPNYGVPSAKWINYYGPTPAILDAIVEQIGQRIVVGLDGTVRTVNWETARAASDLYLANAPAEMSGGQIPCEDIIPYLPSSVNVLFLDTSVTPTTVSPHVVNELFFRFASGGNPFCTGLTTASGMPGYSQIIPADIAYDGSNTTDVNDYADTAAEDWYGWMMPDVDIVWPGIEPYQPTGWEDAVEWTFQIRQDANGKDVPYASTQVRRKEFNDFPSGNFFMGTHPDINNDTTPTDCISCGWLANRVPLIPYIKSGITYSARAFRVKVFPGADAGQCSCITGQGLENTDPIFALYDVIDGKWEAIRNINTCCGCGSLTFDITPTGNRPATARLEMNSSCGGDDPDSQHPGDPYVYDLVYQCCTNDPPSVTFSGGEGDNCNGDPPFPCDNSFLVQFICDECDLDNIVCEDCDGIAPPIIRVKPPTPFMGANKVYNGTWYLDGTGCTWVYTCQATGITITATVVGTVLTVVYSGGGGGGATYSFDRTTGDCFTSYNLPRTAGDSGTTPASIEWAPIFCNGLLCTDIPVNLTISATSSDVSCINGWTKDVTREVTIVPPGFRWVDSNEDKPCNTDNGFTLVCYNDPDTGKQVIRGTWNNCALELLLVTSTPFSMTFRLVGACPPATTGGTIIFVLTET